ncbi:MAG: DNA polymerase III subunit delta [Candidatus Cloacimonetes bacterium]|nr:DNA polymerase III subunit delta [Candidatus Cloacimonadota bacterium]
MQKQKVYQHYEFLREFGKQKPDPAYLIYGPEDYLKDKVLKTITEKFKTPGSEEFDVITLYGDESLSVNVLEQLEMMPFIAKHRLVILKNFDKMIASEKNLIAEYIENPVQTSILILTAEKNDERIIANRIVSEKAVNINCRSPYNADDITRWLRAELRDRNITMDNESISLFSNSIDTDYLIAANELEKLIIYTKNSGNITLNDVIESVGKSKTNKIFDLQNAIGNKDLTRSLQILENMILNNESAIFIIAMLTRFYSLIWKVLALRKKNISDSEITTRHLNEIFYRYRDDYIKYANNYTVDEIRKVFSILLQADVDLKSLNTKEEIILETLVYNICKI